MIFIGKLGKILELQFVHIRTCFFFHFKCCACFGPKGGRLNYCGPKCTALHGGTVMKKIFVWFWVRTRMPERLWKKCMEFRMKNSVGRVEKYFIDPQTGIAHKV